MGRRGWIAVVGLALAVRIAHAQTPAPPPAPEAAPPPTAPSDPPDVEALYQQALGDFAMSKFAVSANEFDEVATRSVDTTRQITARELAKQARMRVGAQPPSGEHPAALQAEARSNDGRYAFLIGTAVLGLGLYGPTLTVVGNTSDSKTGVGLYMLGAGVSFFAPYMLTREQNITWGMTDAWWYGSTRGAVHGYFVYALSDPSRYEASTVMGSLSLGSIAEGAAFTIWAQRTNADRGLVGTIGAGADFGAGFALGGSALVLPDSALHQQWAAAATLSGSAAGYVGGYYYAKLREPTAGDPEVMRASGVVGAYAAITPLILAEVKEPRAYAGAAIAGGAAGLIAGDRLLAGRHYSLGQGVVVELSALAGGLTGAGLGYLVSPSNSTTEGKFAITGGLIGGAAGYALAYLELDTRVRPASTPGVSLQVAPDLGPDHRGLVVAGRF